MAFVYHNITGELTQELLEAGNDYRVSKISLTNVHADTPCTVDLYVEKKLKGKFYLLKSVQLPIGATLIYDHSMIDNKTGQFGLYIKLTKSASETPAVDVIIS